jgi:protein-disulfide isomerase
MMEGKNNREKEGRHGSGAFAAKWIIYAAVIAVAFYLAGFFTSGLLFPRPAGELRVIQEQIGRMQEQLNRIAAQLKVGTDQKPSTGAPAPSRPAGVEVSPDDDPVIGAADAAVTMIEFSDFQCPFCRRFFEQTLPQIEEEYIKPGKVRLVYRDFPLSFHQQAQLAAEAAECADDQGKFREMHDRIFQGQTEWAGNSEARAIFAGYAEAIGLDLEEFNRCLDSGQYKEEVQQDFNDGVKYGVTGTPTFFINGQKLVGAQPFAAFQQIIEAELGRSGKE